MLIVRSSVQSSQDRSGQCTVVTTEEICNVHHHDSRHNGITSSPYLKNFNYCEPLKKEDIMLKCSRLFLTKVNLTQKFLNPSIIYYTDFCKQTSFIKSPLSVVVQSGFPFIMESFGIHSFSPQINQLTTNISLCLPMVIFYRCHCSFYEFISLNSIGVSTSDF